MAQITEEKTSQDSYSSVCAVDAKLSIPEPSEWKVELFGMGENGITFLVRKGSVPNAFWRLMQYIILGNKWKRISEQ